MRWLMADLVMGGIQHCGKLLQRCLRVFPAQKRGLAELSGEFIKLSRLFQRADCRHLPHRSVDDLCEVRRLAVDAAVDAVSKVLFDLRLHHAHGGNLRADGSQKIFNVVALLKI